MKKATKFIITLLVIGAFLFGLRIISINKIKLLDEDIFEKESLIENNDLQITDLSSKKDELVKNYELVKKEYKVWIHQNEKLENILH